MKFFFLYIIVFTGNLYGDVGTSSTLGESIDIITKLENSGKWKEALPIYRQWHKKLRFSFDGLTVKFMLRKGVCELQCAEFNDAQESFSWITTAEADEIPRHERIDRTRAKFYLAEAQARSGKTEASKKSLLDANKCFEKFREFESNPGMQLWRSRIEARITAANRTNLQKGE